MKNTVNIQQPQKTKSARSNWQALKPVMAIKWNHEKFPIQKKERKKGKQGTKNRYDKYKNKQQDGWLNPNRSIITSNVKDIYYNKNKHICNE